MFERTARFCSQYRAKLAQMMLLVIVIEKEERREKGR